MELEHFVANPIMVKMIAVKNEDVDFEGCSDCNGGSIMRGVAVLKQGPQGPQQHSFSGKEFAGMVACTLIWLCQ